MPGAVPSLILDPTGSAIANVQSGSDGVNRLRTETLLTGSIPAGSDIIGIVGIDSTTTGSLATEKTLNNISSSLNQINNLSLETTQLDVSSSLNVIKNIVATEATLLDTSASLNVIKNTVSTEATLLDASASLSVIKNIVATEDTLLAASASLNVIKNTVATETTLLGVSSSLNTIKNTVALEDTQIENSASLVTMKNTLQDGTQKTQVGDGTQWVDTTSSAGDIIRLEVRSVVTGPSGSEHGDVDTMTDTDNGNVVRLQTEALLAPGSTVNIGTGIPSDPSDLVISFLTNTGSSDMLVDGSSTPADFEFTASATSELSLDQLLIVFSADDFEFDGSSFGPNSLLTNGIVIQTVIGGSVTEIFNIRQNEDYLRVPGRTPVVNNTGPKDILAVDFAFGGLVKLASGSSDLLRVRIRDNLTSVKLKYLTATIYAIKED